MKRISLWIIMFLTCLALASCATYTIELSENSVEMYVGEEYEITVTASAAYTTNVRDEKIISFEDGVIKAKKVGSTKIEFIINGQVLKTLKVEVLEKEECPFEWSVSREGHTKVALCECCAYPAVEEPHEDKNNDSICDVCEYDMNEFVPQLTASKTSVSLEEGQSEEITLTTNVEDAEYEVRTSNKDIAVFEDGKVVAKKAGQATITISLKEYSEKFVEIKVTVVAAVVDEEAPVIEFDSQQQKFKVNLFEKFDPLKGVKATDNIDGDITNKIVVEGTVDTNNYGTYKLTYIAKDKAGNEAEITKEFEVVWGYSVEFIGHGGSYYGVMNTEEAILYAAQVLKYQAIEVDLAMTSDGVFVLCHDPSFGGKTVASTPWSELKDVEATSTKSANLPMKEVGQSSITYKSKIDGSCIY